MTRYCFVINATISLHTDVEAESLEEAIEEAKGRVVMSLCHQCAAGEPDSRDEWRTSGELDTDPSGAELVDLIVEDLGGANAAAEYERAVGLWSE